MNLVRNDKITGEHFFRFRNTEFNIFQVSRENDKAINIDVIKISHMYPQLSYIVRGKLTLNYVI